jgi:Tol biopolymer transport system component
MPLSFDWEFEEDHPERSGRDAPETGAGQGASPRRRWLRRGLVILVLLAAAGLGLRAWYQERLRIIERAEEQLRALVTLELEALAAGDAELFRARQDPADPRWRDRQMVRYFDAGAAPFAPAPGLGLSDRPTEIESLHLSGRKARAELVRWFQTGAAGSPLPFRLTWFYRQNRDGTWYHVAPTDGYWGDSITWQGPLLDLHLTRAEAEALVPPGQALGPASPWGLQFDRILFRACRWMRCADRGPYTLRFADVPWPQIEGDLWRLPALTLAGRPADAHARQAWERALELWLVEALAHSQVGAPDLTQRLIYHQLVSRLQDTLGLQAGPTLVESAPVEAPSEAALRRLWQAQPDPSAATDPIDPYRAGAPQETRGRQAEVAAFLDLVQAQVGAPALFRLLPALGQYDQPLQALTTLYDLDRVAFTAAWSSQLARLAGSAPATGLAANHLALLCSGRLWVASADGSHVRPLTLSDQRFSGLHWSPDGRWLLTRWMPDGNRLPGALSLWAADGSTGWILKEEADGAAHNTPAGWTPEGRRILYLNWQEGTVARAAPGVWTLDIQTGQEDRLPGYPDWSPNGRHLIYDETPFAGVWSADLDWENRERIADRASLVRRIENWSPDGSRLAVKLYGETREESQIAIYHAGTGQLTPLITLAQLRATVLDWAQDPGAASVLSDGSDPALLAQHPLQRLWPLGWSADGRQLLVWAYSTPRDVLGAGPVVLAVVPLEPPDAAPGSSATVTPRILAYTAGRFLNSAVWSPTHPQRLALTWPTNDRDGAGADANAFLIDLIDLQAGPLYSAFHPGATAPAWSPDGDWLAFSSEERVNVLDHQGQERYAFTPGDSQRCSTVTWNPSADLESLGRTSNPPRAAFQRGPDFSSPAVSRTWTD